MGTNYYVKREVCPHCGRGDGDLHVGKSSGGWTFALHVYPDDNINTLDDWKPILERSEIRDEYGRSVSYPDLLAVITEREHPRGLSRSDIDGHHCVGHGEGTYDYCTGDFS